MNEATNKWLESISIYLQAANNRLQSIMYLLACIGILLILIFMKLYQ